MIGKTRWAVALVALLAAPTVAFSQTEPVTDQPAVIANDPRTKADGPFNRVAGLDLALTNEGLGIGGQLGRQVTPDLLLYGQLSIGPGKGDREFKYTNYDYRGYSYPVTLNKAASMVMAPLLFGAQYRIGRENISDNFRPFIQAAAGPVIGYVLPRYTFDGDMVRFADQFHPVENSFGRSISQGNVAWGAGGTIGGGAQFGDGRSIQGVTIRYYIYPFFDPVKLSLNEGTAKREGKRIFQGVSLSLNFNRFY